MGDIIKGKEKKPAITEQQLFETCDSYFEQHNKEPSQQVIRNVIGGSPATIGPLLRKWKEKRGNEEQAKMLMPDHIREGGMTIVATWWQSIQPTINDMISSAQELADKKVGVAKQESEDAIATQIWLEQENERLETLLKTTGNDYEQKISEQATERKAFEEQLSELRMGVSKSEGELVATKQLLSDTKKENKAEHAAQKKELASVLKEKVMAEAKLDVLNERLLASGKGVVIKAKGDD